MKGRYILFFVCTLLLVIMAGAIAIKPTPITIEIPQGWPQPTNNPFTKNTLTEEGFQLGRKLFYDSRLSRDSTVSCASCHQQFSGFATFDHDVSHGINNGLTTRNAPGLFNLVWMKTYHWDGGISSLETQALSPLTAPNEMGETAHGAVAKIKSDPDYVKMFHAAFGSKKITEKRMLNALAQFTSTLVSGNSKYDKVMHGMATFHRVEERGYTVFKKHCASCHEEPLFTDNTFRNIGRPLNRFNDIGRMAITKNPEDSLLFRVPTLRNIQVTYPYMHDGSIFSVPQVIDHYRFHVDTSQPTLDQKLKNRINMSDRERDELTYFLYTLTDSTFLNNKRFSRPHNIKEPQPIHLH